MSHTIDITEMNEVSLSTRRIRGGTGVEYSGKGKYLLPLQLLSLPYSLFDGHKLFLADQVNLVYQDDIS